MKVRGTKISHSGRLVGQLLPAVPEMEAEPAEDIVPLTVSELVFKLSQCKANNIAIIDKFFWAQLFAQFASKTVERLELCGRQFPHTRVPKHVLL